MRLMLIAAATPSVTNVSQKVSLNAPENSGLRFSNRYFISIPPSFADHLVVMLAARTFADVQK
jgi:hypothetical protein